MIDNQARRDLKTLNLPIFRYLISRVLPKGALKTIQFSIYKNIPLSS